MLRNKDEGGAEPSEAASDAGMGEALELAGTGGMAALGVALAVLGEPPGYSDLFVRYGLMGASMAAPMAGWMRLRGHPWRDGGEMAGAMLVPMLAPAALVEAGAKVPGLSEGSLMAVSHAAMIGGMVALMVYRSERYTRAIADLNAPAKTPPEVRWGPAAGERQERGRATEPGRQPMASTPQTGAATPPRTTREEG